MERQFVPDRATDDLDDPDLGAAALDDASVGGGGEAGGSGFWVGFEEWPDDDEAEIVPRRQPASDHGAGSSTAPGCAEPIRQSAEEAQEHGGGD